MGALGALLQTQSNFLVSLLAAGLVAVLFAPLRDRLQCSVNRLMYGERDEPYTVLSRLRQHLEATIAPDAALMAIVETVAQALKRDGGFEIAAVHGSPTGESTVLPLVYQGETIGQLVLAPRAPSEPFTLADRRLLEGVARHVEVAVHAVRLTADLQRSRERLVTVREEERRRLRRDLHDGLGPTLAGLTFGLGAARNLLTHEPEDADTLLARLKDQTQEAVSPRFDAKNTLPATLLRSTPRRTNSYEHVTGTSTSRSTAPSEPKLLIALVIPRDKLGHDLPTKSGRRSHDSGTPPS